MWGEDFIRANPEIFKDRTLKSVGLIRIDYGNGPAYELGLRSDGVVVWREVAP